MIAAALAVGLLLRIATDRSRPYHGSLMVVMPILGVDRAMELRARTRETGVLCYQLPSSFYVLFLLFSDEGKHAARLAHDTRSTFYADNSTHKIQPIWSSYAPGKSVLLQDKYLITGLRKSVT